jgi:ribulose kinase
MDFGTLSGRLEIIDVVNGRELPTTVHENGTG